MSSLYHRRIFETVGTDLKKTVIRIMKVRTHTFKDKSHVEGTQTYARYEFKELQKKNTIIN